MKLGSPFGKEYNRHFSHSKKYKREYQQQKSTEQQPDRAPSFQGPSQTAFIMTHDPGQAAVLESMDHARKQIGIQEHQDTE